MGHLGLSLGVLALPTMVHLLLTSVRRRRRDLAVLRAIGFTRRQIQATGAWQAVVLTGAALVIGIPAGIVCGRLAWRIFTGQIGIPPVLDIPLLSLAILVAAGLALAIALAAVPGHSVARPAEWTASPKRMTAWTRARMSGCCRRSHGEHHHAGYAARRY
jgi:predicted lysophospholipase L1 biosynthesis ABC-type transport system permease subunit